MKGRSKLLSRYVMSYLAILTAPLLVLAVIIYQGMVSNLKKDIDARSLGELQRIGGLIESDFAELKTISSQIFSDSQITRYMFASSEVNRLTAMNVLKRYCTYTKVEQILIYYRGDDVTYSSRGIASMEATAQSSYMKDSWSAQTLYEALNENRSPYLDTGTREVNRDTAGRWFNFICPMTSSAGTEIGKIVFTINTSRFSRYLNAEDGTEDISFFLYDEAGNSFFQENRHGLTGSEAAVLLKEAADSDSPILETKLGSKRLCAVSVTLERYGWRLLMLLSSTQHYENYNRNAGFAVGIFCIVLTSALSLSYIMSKRSYNQIKKLLEFMTARFSFSPAVNGNEFKPDELGLIRLAMESASNQVTDLQEKVEWLESRSTNEYLVKFLHQKDDFTGELPLRELFERSGLHDSFSDYCILLVSFTQKPTMSREAILYFLKEAAVFPKTELCFVDMMAEQTVSVIAQSNREDVGLKQEVAERLCELLESQTGSRVIVAVGGSYHSLAELPHSYQESVLSLRYKDQLPGEKIIMYSGLAQMGNIQWWYPDQQLMLLSKYIVAADYDKIDHVIGELKHTLFTVLSSGSTRKSVLFEVYNTLIKLAVKLNITISLQQIDLLLLSEDSKSFALNMTAFCHKAADELEKAQGMEFVKLAKNVLRFTGENFTDTDFSLVSLALHFNVSLSYLSRLFKDETGETFTDYITKLRIERCKQLLIQTDKPVKDIVQEIGYLDTSNFIRKFRTLENMTPGKYRETMRGAGRK